MRKILVTLAMAAGLTALAATPALAETVTRTIVGESYTLTCVITYTDMNGNGRIDLLRELLSITNVTCTVTRNS
ncbi:MAG TPA: hypothetical protein VGJ80_04380 [Gemmatimonadales bacterium]